MFNLVVVLISVVSFSQPSMAARKDCLQPISGLRVEMDYILKTVKEQQKIMRQQKLDESWSEIATETLKWGDLYENYPCHPQHRVIRSVYINYIRILARGLDRSPLYDAENFKMNPDVRRAYELVLARNRQTHAAKSLLPIEEYFERHKFYYPKDEDERQKFISIVDRILTTI